MTIVLIRSNPVRPYPRLEKMANSLSKLGHEVVVLAWDRDRNYKPREEILSLRHNKARIIRIGIKGQFSGGVKKNLKGLLLFQKFIFFWLINNKDSYDVIHAYDLDTGFIAQIAATVLNKVFIYDIPDYYCDSHGYTGGVRKVVKRIENTVINKSFATIICTEERKQQIYPARPKRLIVIHNTPDLEVDTANIIQSPRIRLVYVGIFGKARFIDRIAEIVSRRNDCEFHIGGYGANMESYFENMAKSNENIYYYGRLLYEDTLKLEKSCDVICAVYDPQIENHRYAAPNKFYEALALGKPMIMAKGTGMSSVLEKNDLGETIEFNSDSFEKAIDRLMTRKDEWAEIGKREQALYESTYSWNEMEKRIQRLYDEVELAVKG